MKLLKGGLYHENKHRVGKLGVTFGRSCVARVCRRATSNNGRGNKAFRWPDVCLTTCKHVRDEGAGKLYAGDKKENIRNIARLSKEVFV